MLKYEMKQLAQKSGLNSQYEDELSQEAKIILVSKTKMENWRKDQEDLGLAMENQSKRVEDTLIDEKMRYYNKVNAMEKVK